MTSAPHARAARLRTITDSSLQATLIATSSFTDDYGGSTAQAQALRRALFCAGNFEDSEGIYQGEVVSRLSISVGAQQRKRVVPCVHQGLPETADQGSVDIADEVAEVIDRHDEPRHAARIDRGLVHPGRHNRFRRRPQIGGHAPSSGQFRRNGCKDVPPVESSARPVQTEARQSRRIKLNNRCARVAGDDWGEQPIIGREKHMILHGHRHYLARCADAGIDDGDVHSSGWKVLEGASQPEPRLCRPVNDDLVGEIDDPGFRKSRKNDSLHDPHKGALVSEVSGDCNDT
jgi:hypothetical protein